MSLFARRAAGWLMGLLLACAASVAWGQAGFGGRGAVPSDAYFATFALYHDGEYDQALSAFVSEGRGAIKTVQSNWIDSIAYHTMAGECFYQVGQLSKAMVHYNSALQLYVAFSNWMIRVQFPAAIAPAMSNQVKPIPWGQWRRPVRLGRFPETMLTLQGQVNNNQQVQQGGVVQQAQLFPLRVEEIIRSTALAIRRRGEILGPLAEHDPLSKEVLAALARRPTQPNHWSEAWIDVQLGLAYAAIGKVDQARPILERSILVGGEYDHPLSAHALFALGRIALAQGDFQRAEQCFEEATFDAYEYGDPALLEEAFRYGFTTFLMAGGQGVWPPLQIAATWAKAQGLRQLNVSLVLMAAENMDILGQTPQAAVLVANARTLIGNRRMLRGKIGARLNYLLALTQYQQGQTAAADASLANLLAFQSTAAHWIYQIALADSYYTAGTLTPRVLVTVYQQLLRDPQPGDWTLDPLEALSVISTPHPTSYEYWFETALERRDAEMVLEIADRARRHHFLSTLPVGGRVLGLRWLLEAPPEALDQQALLERQDLLARYPGYAQLSQQAAAERAQLQQMPLVSEEPDAHRAQAQALEALANTSAAQEQILSEMAVRRNPATWQFPPVRTAKALKEALPPGQAILAFYTTVRQVYGFLVTKDGVEIWPITDPTRLHRQVGQLLRDMGHVDGNRELPRDQAASDKWKRHAAELFDRLTENAKTNFPEGLEELVIVPDGSLWYVPFAALQLGAEGHQEPLIAKLRLRFAPTASLAVGDPRGVKQAGNTAVVLGRLFPRDDDEVAAAAFEDLSQAVAGAVALRGTVATPSSIYASLIDRLIVLEDINETEKGGPYGWSPLQLDHKSPDGLLANWLALPLPGPEQMILPGFHSSAENALKRRDLASAGDDLFLSVCALLASGARTVLISQWRTGGQTSLDLVREFVQELPHTTAADAWQRSVLLAMASQLNPEAEPRLHRDPKKEPPKAGHPFFWAGYLLIDPGPSVEKPAAAAPDVAQQFNNAAGAPAAAANPAADQKPVDAPEADEKPAFPPAANDPAADNATP